MTRRAKPLLAVLFALVYLVQSMMALAGVCPMIPDSRSPKAPDNAQVMAQAVPHCHATGPAAEVKTETLSLTSDQPAHHQPTASGDCCDDQAHCPLGACVLMPSLYFANDLSLSAQTDPLPAPYALKQTLQRHQPLLRPPILATRSN